MNKKVKDELVRAMDMKSRAKALEYEAKILNDSAKAILVPLMKEHELKDYVVPGLGKVILRTNRGSTVDSTKLRENLLINGVSINIIDVCIEEATKSWTSEYVEFKEEK